jgi:hypothetical protein
VDLSQQYRTNAAECFAMARELTDPQKRVILLDMASCWLRLARQAEKNRQVDLVYETPPRRESAT